jgi:uncharacterized membrane protein YjgN (DUF898 family)
MKPTRSFRIRMAIEFFVLCIAVILAAYNFGDGDRHIVWRGVSLVGGVLFMHSAIDRWGYFWDGPDE